MLLRDTVADHVNRVIHRQLIDVDDQIVKAGIGRINPVKTLALFAPFFIVFFQNVTSFVGLDALARHFKLDPIFNIR